MLSEKEAACLAPAVAQWLAVGVTPRQITAQPATGLPGPFLTHPAGILAYRRDGCERAFRAHAPGRCRDCRRTEGSPSVAA
ncbi:hypothetical protein [Streptomyces sp. WAC00469]|uniref:hypothetical protein n=1 Tax=Streptomyces sp. WAC00469 TaxID=2487415 RepID=UPI0026ADE942|nr:hypothetical protein [Streptomyces sp. WAC00469]